MSHHKTLLLTFLAYALAEAAWMLMMRPFYARSFQRVQPGTRLQIDGMAAVLAYALVLLTLWASIINPVLRGPHPVWRSAMLGLAVYGVYNLTNRATLKGYPWVTVAVDTAWGVAVFTGVHLLASYLNSQSTA